jgi:prephenate dehydratase
MKVSIQGQKASYSHIATAEWFGKETEILSRDSFREVFEDLDKNRAESIIVPIENSTYGSIYQNYDLLTEFGYEIVGEIYLRINFHLIVLPETKFEDIETLYVHPVALGQIQSFVKDNPQITFIEHADTAGSVKKVRDEHLKNAAGTASKFAAEFYEMKILEENIHENPKNYTRFYILSKTPKGVLLSSQHRSSSADEQGKTTLQFQLGEEAGSLYKSLRAFADRDIALSKIESRPIINTDWEYRFYLDVMSGVDDEKMQSAMNELKDYVRELVVLGSYKQGEYVNT